MLCKLFVKQTVFLSRFAVFCRINKQKSKKRFPTLCSDKKSFKNKSLLFSFYAPQNPLRHDRLLKDLMPQATENRFRHRCFCRILSVGRSAVFSRSAYARIGKVRYIIFMTAEKRLPPNRMSDNRFFSFVLYKRGLIALREISAKISEERRALNKIQLLRGRKRRKFLTAPLFIITSIKNVLLFEILFVFCRKQLKKRLFFEMLCDIILVYEKNRDVSVVKTAYSPQAFGDFLIELKNKGGCLSVF